MSSMKPDTSIRMTGQVSQEHSQGHSNLVSQSVRMRGRLLEKHLPNTMQTQLSNSLNGDVKVLTSMQRSISLHLRIIPTKSKHDSTSLEQPPKHSGIRSCCAIKSEGTTIFSSMVDPLLLGQAETSWLPLHGKKESFLLTSTTLKQLRGYQWIVQRVKSHITHHMKPVKNRMASSMNSLMRSFLDCVITVKNQEYNASSSD